MDQMDQTKQLEEASIPRLLIRFSIPGIVGMLVNALYNIVDRIFVGRGVGSLGIAGTTVAFPIMLITMAFSMLIGIGASSLISIRLGQKKQAEAELIAGNAVVMLLLIAIIFSGSLLAVLNPLLNLLGTSADVLPYARDYLRIILLGTVFVTLSFGVNNFIRAEGNPRIAMYTMLIGAVFNVALDYLLIFIIPLGIKGAAWATNISQAISCLWVLSYFFSGKGLLKVQKKNFQLDKRIMEKIFIMGLPPFAMQLVNSLQQVILVKSLSVYGGDLAISAMGIIFSVSTILVMPVIGINQGAQPIIGYNYGARNYARVKEALKDAILGATLVVVTGYVLVRSFPQQIIGLFNKNDVELIALGVHGLLTFFSFLPVIGFQIVCANYFQAVGKPKQATFLNLSRQLLLFIPTLLILPRFWGLEGIWWTAPVADLGSCILTGTWIFHELRNLDNKQLQEGLQN